MTSTAGGRTHRFDTEPWTEVDDLLRKKVVDAERMTATRYSFAPGGRFPHHTHPEEQLTYLLTGSVTFTVDGDDHVLEPGDLIVIPPGVPHDATAGSRGAEVLSLVSPRRGAGETITVLE